MTDFTMCPDLAQTLVTTCAMLKHPRFILRDCKA